jgi:hypothetical protein
MKLLLALAVMTGCTVHHLERKTSPTLATVDQKAPFLKAHMKDGDVYVLDRWTAHDRDGYLEGDGNWLGADRHVAGKGHFRIAFAEVAIYETNTIIESKQIASVAILTGLSLVGSALCIANPKACFGSCPTFYAKADDGRWMLQAEGFSEAIAPALENNDIDSLWRTTGRGGPMTIRMTNEAYETHVVKQADLLAIPRPPNGRVLWNGSEFFSASAVAPPETCTGPEGSCLDRVRTLDGDERTSLADGSDLAARETIEVEFAPVTGRGGVVIGARQSLVTTFLLYQGLAYFGDTLASWLTKLDHGDTASIAGGRTLGSLIGGIEVMVEHDGAWQVAGTVHETGPLATDVHLVLLPDGADGRHVRLRLPRGSWRIDYIALATIAGPATPVRIAPKQFRGVLGREYAASRAVATSFPIVTMPGDAYEFDYELPPGDDYELYLDSRGYYLEWMRAEWLREQSPWSALRMLVDPATMLRELAPAFKKAEPSAEKQFWGSRYAHP